MPTKAEVTLEVTGWFSFPAGTTFDTEGTEFVSLRDSAGAFNGRSVNIECRAVEPGCDSNVRAFSYWTVTRFPPVEQGTIGMGSGTKILNRQPACGGAD